ncbi:MAG: hypothetical protein KGZ79_07660 [Dethiobacter sp.]|jgi:chromosome segregation ATPase|nr:hypothetical protein [Dethiobacter sp.]
MDNEKIMEFMSTICSDLKELKEGQIKDRKSLELIAAQTGKLTITVDNIEHRVNNIENRLNNIENRLNNVENRLNNVENRLNNVEHKFDSIEDRIENSESRFDNLESDIKTIKEIVIKIENEHSRKINILFNGHLQNREKIAEHDKLLDALR